MKKCSWCKEQKPDNEEGGQEVKPDSEDVTGWVCNYCLAAYLGWEEDEMTYNEFVADYNARSLSERQSPVLGIGLI